jgi:hypothetical protein
MRDFRDAKTLAHTLRGSLAAKGLKITIGQSLELVAELFGVADWNTLAAAIRREASATRKTAAAPPRPAAGDIATPSFSRGLEQTLHRALAEANAREHEYATLEHLLLALIDDPAASPVMLGCQVDLGVLKANLVSYIDNDLKQLVITDGRDASPTPAFKRVMERAALLAQNLNRDATGADVLLGLFAETQSHAVWFLGQQEMTRFDAVNILHGIVKERGDRNGDDSSKPAG